LTGYSFSADGIDTSAPHSARMYDYWLGGKTHYEADAQAAEAVLGLWPGVRTGAQVNRWFMRRAARWLAEEAGVRQFLDVGSGIPTTPNLHQVTQAVAPQTRVLYVDNDPIVLTYSEALLQSTGEGRTEYLHADVTDPAGILSAPLLRETLDLTRPVGLSMMALLHFVTDEGGPYDLVRQLMDALPSGSYLMLTHCTPELDPAAWARLAELAASRSDITGQARSHAEVRRFFDGLELVEPGVVVPHRWRPDGDPSVAGLTDGEVSLYAGVARKP
jgi:hypothetical protein